LVRGLAGQSRQEARVTTLKNWVVAAGCTGKDPLSPERARQIAKRMTRKHGANVNAYRCRACGQWHVGHNRDGARLNVR
jgi:hypothetical protein